MEKLTKISSSFKLKRKTANWIIQLKPLLAAIKVNTSLKSQQLGTSFASLFSLHRGRNTSTGNLAAGMPYKVVECLIQIQVIYSLFVYDLFKFHSTVGASISIRFKIFLKTNGGDYLIKIIFKIYSKKNIKILVLACNYS